MIVLVPVGQVKKSILVSLSDRLAAAFGQRIAISGSNVSPEAMWDPRRKQYLADTLVGAIGRIHRGRIKLGIIDADIFAPGMNFVFGEADRSRRSAVISLARLRQDYYGLPANEHLLQNRVAKEAIHELGHILGLAHCANSACVMHFSNALADTDVKGDQFCLRCSHRLSSPGGGPVSV